MKVDREKKQEREKKDNFVPNLLFALGMGLIIFSLVFSLWGLLTNG